MLCSSVFVITERKDMTLYEVPLSVSLLDFGISTMFANFHVWGIMFLLRAVLTYSWGMRVQDAYLFKGPDIWFGVSVMLYACMFCVAMSM